jgi:hypothetical protein
MELWICGPLFISSLVNTCWLFQFCEEEWLSLKPGFFAVPTFITLCFGIGWTATYYLEHFYRGDGSFLPPQVIYCLCLTLSSSLPYLTGWIVRLIKERGLFIPGYHSPSRLVNTIYTVIIFTPAAGIVTFFLIEVCFILTGNINSAIPALATPMDLLQAELWFFGGLYFAGLPLGLLGRFLFKKQSKPKENPFTYH